MALTSRIEPVRKFLEGEINKKKLVAPKEGKKEK